MQTRPPFVKWGTSRVLKTGPVDLHFFRENDSFGDLAHSAA